MNTRTVRNVISTTSRAPGLSSWNFSNLDFESSTPGTNFELDRISAGLAASEESVISGNNDREKALISRLKGGRNQARQTKSSATPRNPLPRRRAELPSLPRLLSHRFFSRSVGVIFLIPYASTVNYASAKR